MKHLTKLSVLLIAAFVVALCLFASPTKANAATDGYYTYTVSNGEATITDCDTSISGTVTIPSTLGGYAVTGIGRVAFYGCKNMTAIMIPDGVSSIGDSAFYQCTGLSAITLPNSLTTIGTSAFYYCSKLTSIVIPDNVVSIGLGAFCGCGNMQSITIPFVGGSRKSATDTYQYPFGYIFGEGSYTGGVSTTQYYYGASTTTTTYSKYYIPSSLKSVTVTNGDILRGAFFRCSNLVSITLPNNLTSIELKAFFGCSGLTDVYFVGTAEQWSNVTIAADNTYLTNARLHYVDPCASGHRYDADHKCTLCDAIGGTCGENLVWTLDEAGLLTISGTGTMTNYDEDEEEYAPWYHYRSSIIHVVVQEGVTTVGRDAFRNCKSLVTVTTPQSMQSFGYRSFSDCTSLENIMIPAAQSVISPYTFSGCDSLTEVTIPNSVTSIEFAAFYGAGLKKLVIPDSVTSISENAFKMCSDLQEIVIGKGVTFLGPQAFGFLQSGPTVTFLGNPPRSYTYDAFATSPYWSYVIAYYPAGNPAWTETAMRCIDRDAVWKMYCPGHDWADATCTAPSTCVLCGETTGNALGHSWEEATCSAPKNCVTCGKTEGETLMHSGTNEQCELCDQMADNFWVIPSDATIHVSLTQDICVDLNGYDLSGTITTNGYKVYGMDSATNEYTCDSMGYFSCVDENGNAIVPKSLYTTEDQLRYMTIGTEDGYTFHHYYLGITNLSLAPAVTGFGYKAEFRGDEMVQSKIASIGFNLWLDGGKTVSRTTDFQNSLTLRLKNFDVAKYGETPVNACVIITLTDGTVIESSTASYSMRQMVETVNDQYADLNETQLSAIASMIANNPTMRSWLVENIYKAS